MTASLLLELLLKAIAAVFVIGGVVWVIRELG